MTKRKPGAVMGRPRELPPEQRTINVRFSKADFDALRWHAYDREVKVAAVIRDAVSEFLRRNPVPTIKKS